MTRRLLQVLALLAALTGPAQAATPDPAPTVTPASAEILAWQRVGAPETLNG